MRVFMLTVFLCLFSQTSVFASGAIDRQCVSDNIKRCLVQYDRPVCTRLLANACIKGPGWNRRCVNKHAPRCWQAKLTRKKCLQALRPICKR
jgi:hypothetical protein